MWSSSRIEKEFGKRPQLAVLQQARKKEREAAQQIDAAATEAGRDFTETEATQYKEHISALETLNMLIGNHAETRGFDGSRSDARHDGSMSWLIGEGEGRRSGQGNGAFSFPGIARFLETGEGGIKAALTEGSDLQFVVPGYEVEQFLQAYPSTDPLTEAGASITQLDGGWVDGHQPIIVAGTDPSTYAEGTGPTADEGASVFVAKLDDPAKIAFLCKPTEEAIQDIDQLAAQLGREGIRRIYNKVAKSVIASLVASLTTAGATVAHTGDNLEDLLSVIAAIPSYFAGSTNAFMLSRRTLALIRNTRVGANNMPVFDPTSKTILGYPAVQTDYVPPTKMIFGDFRSGLYLRRCAISFQRLNEVYKEQGKVGLRFMQRADWVSFSEAANASQSEQPLVLLTSDWGS